LFNHLGITLDYLKGQQRAMAGVQQNVAYRQELIAGDVVEVRSRILEIRERALRVECEMRNVNRDSALAALVESSSTR
jgi:acyl-CoA thioester hydrolase